LATEQKNVRMKGLRSGGAVVGRVACLLVMVGVLTASSGCAYLQDRGGDALDMMDIGLTVSDHLRPDFALYQDYMNVLPHGWAHVDGRYLGVFHREVGSMELRYRAWGVIVTGSTQLQVGEFDPFDWHQAWVKDMEALQAAGEPLPTEAPRYNQGVIRMAMYDNIPPLESFMSCERIIHLGWIGIYMSLHPVEIADFIIGWTTIDIVGDDMAGKTVSVTEPPPAAPE